MSQISERVFYENTRFSLKMIDIDNVFFEHADPGLVLYFDPSKPETDKKGIIRL